MDPEHRRVFSDNLRDLAEVIDVKRLKESLLQKKIFTKLMLEDIYKEKSDTDQKQFLLSELPSRGPHAFERFIEVLNETGQLKAIEVLTGAKNKLNPSQLHVIPSREVKFGPRIYKMTSVPRGHCLIINNVEFEDVSKNRLGAELDELRLDKLFDGLGYVVHIRRDLSKQLMEDKLRAFAAKPEHKDVDSSVVIILSHGNQNGIEGTEGVKGTLSMGSILCLFDNYNCPLLKGKPKLFFIQACRGSMPDIGVPNMESADSSIVSNRLPTLSDIVISYSTVHGNSSIRHHDLGSWYCQALVSVLMVKSCNTGLSEMLREVDSIVKEKISYDGVKQATEDKYIGWDKELYFNPNLQMTQNSVL